MSPTETNDEIPMPSLDRCSVSDTPIPPDWTTRPAVPSSGRSRPKVASSPMPGTAMPKQFGPTSRMPYLRQVASRSGPAAPSPEVTTTSERTPRRPHCSATSGTAGAGTATIARSTSSGRSATERTHGTPATSSACGLTG